MDTRINYDNTKISQNFNYGIKSPSDQKSVFFIVKRVGLVYQYRHGMFVDKQGGIRMYFGEHLNGSF